MGRMSIWAEQSNKMKCSAGKKENGKIASSSITLRYNIKDSII